MFFSLNHRTYRGKLQFMKRGLSTQLRLVKSKAPKAARTGKKLAPLKVAGLFAGIGGIELGMSNAGHHARLLCEIDPAAREVLEDKFPDVPKWDDVCTLEAVPDDVDLIAAGFPCQDLSQAGKTLGISGSRSGLVGEVFRLLRQRATEWVLIENVPFMLQLGRGKALDVIISSLEELGYKWAYRVVNSRSFGVPQRRERVYLLASLNHDPRDILFVDNVEEPKETRTFRQVACGFYWTEGIRGLGWAVDSVPTLKGGSTIGIPSPPAIIFPDGLIAKPDLRDAERMQGFPVDWTAAAERVSKRGHRWKLVGNAVTVNAAQWIGERLRDPGAYDSIGDMAMKANASWPKAAWNVGTGRHVASAVTTFPMITRSKSLADFLAYEPEPLSPKATAGFLSRTQVSSLRFPDGFIAALERHLASISGDKVRAII